MVDSISRGFINKNRIAEEQVLDNNVNKLSKTEEQVKKGIIDFNKRLSKSIYVFSKAIHTLEDTRETRELKSKLDKAIKTSSIQDKIRKGKSVSSTEAKELIQAAEDMNDVMLNNEKLRIKIKELGYKSENLDITKPLVTASQKIAESAKEVFINNAERITQSEVGSDLAKTGVRAVSPELAFISESLGVGLPNFFESEDQEEDVVVTELSKLNDSVGNLEDAVGGVSDATKEGILDEIEYLKELIDNLKSYPKQTQDIVDEIKQLEEEIKIYQNTLQDIETDKANEQKKTAKKQIKSDQKIAEQAIQADNKRNEENLLVQADQHKDQMEILDDIKDLQNKSIFEKLMDFLDIRKSPFLKKAGIVAAATAATNAITSSTRARTIGATAVSAGKTAVKAGAAVGGTVLGFDAFRNIREEGLTSGNALQATASGAMLGSIFGPYGAVIGGGVGALAAVITSAISPQDMKTIESGLKSASDFISKGLGEGISSTIKHSKELYTAIQEGKLTEWFGKIGEGISTSIKEIRDKVNTKLSETISGYDDVFNDIGSRIDSFIISTKETAAKITESYKKNNPESYKADAAVWEAISLGVKDMMDFISSPGKYLTGGVFDGNAINDAFEDTLAYFMDPLFTLSDFLKTVNTMLGGDSEKLTGFITGVEEWKAKRDEKIKEREERMKGNTTAALQQKEIDKTQALIRIKQANQEMKDANSIPETTNTTAINAPNTSATALEMKADQDKTVQEIQQLKEKQEQKTKEDKKPSKTESKPDKVSGYSSRNHSNVSLNGNIGLAILTANIA